MFKTAGQGQFYLPSAIESIHRNSRLEIYYGKQAEKLRMKIEFD